MDVRVHRGRTAWSEFADDIDRLQRRLETPITARRPWLDTWLDCYRDFEAAFVTIHRDDTLAGLAPLGVCKKGGVSHFVPMGHGPSDVVEFAATSADVRTELTKAMVAMMSESCSRWTFTAGNLLANSPVVPALLHQLKVRQVTAGNVLPRTEFTDGRELRSYVSRNHHQQVRRLRNRAERDGLDLAIEHLGGPELIAVLDDLIAIQGRREVDAGRRLKTKDLNDGAFLRKVITVHAAQGLVEATILSVKGTPAAFTITFLDNGVRRLWTLAFDPVHRDYGIGRMCVDASLERALEDSSCREYDWMKGDESYKSTFANGSVRTVDVLGWSSESLRVVFDSGRRVRKGLKERADDDPRIQRIVDLGMRARTSWWHRSIEQTTPLAGAGEPT